MSFSRGFVDGCKVRECVFRGWCEKARAAALGGNYVPLHRRPGPLLGLVLCCQVPMLRQNRKKKEKYAVLCLRWLAGVATKGLEPLACGLEGCCSVLLSYVAARVMRCKCRHSVAGVQMFGLLLLPVGGVVEEGGGALVVEHGHDACGPVEGVAAKLLRVDVLELEVHECLVGGLGGSVVDEA